MLQDGRVGRRVIAITAGLAVLAATLLIEVVTPTTVGAVEVPADGATPLTAAASCWEIKQQNPSAPDGVYWLVTPTLVAPQRFYCDMTTDGGGWVLIGRGREGWRTN